VWVWNGTRRRAGADKELAVENDTDGAEDTGGNAAEERGTAGNGAAEDIWGVKTAAGGVTVC
jgi:hypothetical protein